MFFVPFPFLVRINMLYLAAVLLKQFVKKHWQENEENFEHPVVSIQEKVILSMVVLIARYFF